VGGFRGREAISSGYWSQLQSVEKRINDCSAEMVKDVACGRIVSGVTQMQIVQTKIPATNAAGIFLLMTDISKRNNQLLRC
jgi:hypothetical protein